MHSWNSTSSGLLSLTFLMSDTETSAVEGKGWTRFCYRNSGVTMLSGEVLLSTVPLHVRSGWREPNHAVRRKGASLSFASSFLGVRGPSS